MRVFLGGTCNESTWRERLIEKISMDYFNPVVDDWTPAHMEEERKQRRLCDICLYVLTPKMTGVYSVAEIVDDSNKRPEAAVLCVLSTDDGESFTTGQLKSLNQVAEMVRRNGGAAFSSLDTVAAYINSRV